MSSSRLVDDVQSPDKTQTNELTIKKLITESHTTARSKVWWDEEVNIGEKIALMHSELSEDLEEYLSQEEKKLYRGPDGKPEGFIFELADTIIRIADLCGKLDLNLEKALQIKMEFNQTRPYRHGNKKI